MGTRKPIGYNYKKDNTFSTVAKYRPQRPTKYADVRDAVIKPAAQTMANIMVRNFTLRPETAIERKTKEGPWFKNPSGLSRFPGNVPLYTIHKGHEDRRRRPGTAQPNRSKPREYGDPNPGATAPRTPAAIKDLEDELVQEAEARAEGRAKLAAIKAECSVVEAA